MNTHLCTFASAALLGAALISFGPFASAAPFASATPFASAVSVAGTEAASALDQPQSVVSPNGKVALTFDLAGAGKVLEYRVAFAGRDVVLPSPLGLTLADGPIGAGLQLRRVARSRHNETWKPVCGERDTIPDHYRQIVLDFQESAAPHRRLRIVARAYDEGAAFRYVLPAQGGTARVTIRSEQTHFRLPKGTYVYFTPYAQGRYTRVLASAMKGQAERPLTCALPDGQWAALGEADLVDYARMKFRRARAGGADLVSALAGPVTSPLPLATPWRMVMVADRPGQLLEHDYFVEDLCPPCAIADTSWIHPGKVLREVTLSTAGGKACVDFAAAHGISYVEFDAGWYGPEGSGSSDARTVSVDARKAGGHGGAKRLNLQYVIRYARSKGIGILLYVNHIALEKQLDEILPLYEKWGVKGVKFGFVRVGSQKWTSWLHAAIRKAAKYHLVVDVHDEYRPTGVSRTWPNLLTQEGVGGNETMPTATHNVTLPFTRFVAGAADATICYFCKRIKTTHAHQLAAAVVFFSPLQFIYWYDRPSDWHGEKETEFFDHVPTVWDDTKVLAGQVGQFITVARRSGDQWFVGTMTNVDARRLDVPLTFLDAGRKYVAHIYEDGPAGGKGTNVTIRTRTVDRSSTIRADLKPSGGQAIWLVPVR